MQNYLEIALGDNARALQDRRGSRDHYDAVSAEPAPSGLGPMEIEFLAERDSFYIASVGEGGWPYVQHRGGAPGFVQVTDAHHIEWAERLGNRQFVSAGNLANDDRVSLIAVDYPNRRRIKLYGHARFVPASSPAQLDALGVDGRAEGVMQVEVVAFDWNCPKYITPRFTADEVRSVIVPLHERIAELERQLADAQVAPEGAVSPPARSAGSAPR